MRELLTGTNVRKTQNQDDSIRWGIIGCGDVTEKKSGPAYQKTAGFELVAVMRRNREKAEDYARRHGVRAFSDDAEDLISDKSIDAIYIATPPDSHKFYGLRVADAGKICCIEKPLSPSYQESLAIVDAFKEKGLPLFVAYYRRSLPRFEQVKQWLAMGEIGEARHIRWHLSKAPSALDRSGEHNWRTDAQIAPAGYFDDLASHGLDLFAYLLGNFIDVKGFGVNQQGLYSAFDAVSACWRHESGVSGSGSWNFGCHSREDSVEIFGSRGKIKFAVFEDLPVVLDNQAGRQECLIEHPENVQLFHVHNMRDHLTKGARHPSMGESALHASWVMDSILGRL